VIYLKETISKIKIIDNFLEENVFKDIQSHVMGDQFPWYLNDYRSEGNPLYSFQFTHTIITDGTTILSSYFPVIYDAFFAKLGIRRVLRAKLNLTTRTEQLFNHDFHVDTLIKSKTAVFYVNTNNGKTVFKNGEETNSVANRMVIFDSDLEHAATSHTDEKTRVVVNFNYE
tara:strand:- start:284 stop:796 length:513 start_codon:yes stop_codon:yes gene_type:complete